MNPDILKNLASTLARAGAPIIGGAIGGPAGATIAGVVIGALADALGTAPTPEAVQAKIEADPQAAAQVVARVEARQAEAVRELELRLADTANARAAQVEYVKADSPTQWAPVVVTAIVLGAFAIFSWIGMKAQPGTTEREVVMWLLGSWQTLAGMAVAFWLGSSSASKGKEQTIAALMASRSGGQPQNVVAQPNATSATVTARK